MAYNTHSSMASAHAASPDARDAEISMLRDALDHIARTAHQSRSQTVRIRWIEARANGALEGKPYVRGQFREPRNGIAEFEKMQAEIQRLKAPQPAPAGMVLVPSRMHVDASALDALKFTCGGPGMEDPAEGDAWCDGTLWIGDLLQDDGATVHGLHVSCNECPEEGSITLAEFAAAPAAPPPTMDEVFDQLGPAMLRVVRGEVAAPAAQVASSDYYTVDDEGSAGCKITWPDRPGYFYSFGYGEEAEVRAKSVCRALNKERAHWLAAAPAVVVDEGRELVGYAPFCIAFGDKAHPMLAYAGSTESDALGYVLAHARHEGFKGSAKERMQEMGWEIRPVYADTDLAAVLGQEKADG